MGAMLVSIGGLKNLVGFHAQTLLHAGALREARDSMGDTPLEKAEQVTQSLKVQP